MILHIVLWAERSPLLVRCDETPVCDLLFRYNLFLTIIVVPDQLGSLNWSESNNIQRPPPTALSVYVARDALSVKTKSLIDF